MSEHQGRGQLTDRVQEKAKELLGREISLRELRLMPYLQYCLMNSQHLDPAKVSDEERMILAKWRELGYITGGASAMWIDKKFWDCIHELLFLAYVDISREGSK